jgi:hypothetical protein
MKVQAEAPFNFETTADKLPKGLRSLLFTGSEVLAVDVRKRESRHRVNG